MSDLKPTIGEQRVRTKFNPSSSDDVQQVKETHAALINQMAQKSTIAVDGEHKRLYAEAMTRIEDAAMWSVKALTYQAL